MTIVITGAEMITSVGQTRGEVFDNFCKNVSGLKPLQGFDSKKFYVKNAYEILDRKKEFSDEPYRCSRWLSKAVSNAVDEAQLSPVGDPKMVAVVGTGLRELRSLEIAHNTGLDFGIQSLHFTGAIQKILSEKVPVYTFSNACSASNFGLGLACDMLELGQADIAIAAGCDSITESMFGLLDRVNPTKPKSVRPFDKDRRGVIMGDGAAAVVLETTMSAKKRGVEPLSIVRGVGFSCDAHHETAPNIDGIMRSIDDAHIKADVKPEDIDFIMVHGTGTILNDKMEAEAMAGFFGERKIKVLASGIKSMTGHTSGASGMVGVVTAIEAMRKNMVPPTIGLSRPISEAKYLDLVTGSPRKADIRIAQVNAFGFGGVNAVAVLEST